MRYRLYAHHAQAGRSFRLDLISSLAGRILFYIYFTLQNLDDGRFWCLAKIRIVGFTIFSAIWQQASYYFWHRLVLEVILAELPLDVEPAAIDLIFI